MDREREEDFSTDDENENEKEEKKEIDPWYQDLWQYLRNDATEVEKAMDELGKFIKKYCEILSCNCGKRPHESGCAISYATHNMMNGGNIKVKPVNYMLF
jgi:hypothetical protein